MLFQKRFPEIKIGQSIFYQNIPINFIFSKKRTDLCPICIQENMEDMTAKEEENLLIQDISNKLNLIEKHKSVVVHQNKNFTNNIKSSTQDDCIIILDFKKISKLVEVLKKQSRCFLIKSKFLF